MVPVAELMLRPVGDPLAEKTRVPAAVSVAVMGTTTLSPAL